MNDKAKSLTIPVSLWVTLDFAVLVCAAASVAPRMVGSVGKPRGFRTKRESIGALGKVSYFGGAAELTPAYQ